MRIEKWMKRKLMAKEGEGGGGSGGSGGEGGDDADTKLTAQINSIVHKALSERDKRLETKLTNMLNTTVGAKFDEIRQLLVDSTPDPEKEDPKPEGQQPTTKQVAAMSPEERAALKRAQTEAQEAKKAVEEWKTKAEQELQRNLKSEERQLIMAQLQGKVKPALIDIAVDQVHSKHIVRDEETKNILWKDADGTLIPAKDGLSAWIKSEVGKEFAPPRPVAGAGSRSPDGTPIKPGSMTVEALGDIVEQSISRAR